MRKGGIATVLALSATICARTATADDVQTARELFRQAMDDQDAGRFADALGKLRKVEAIKTTPVVHFYIAYDEAKTGQLVDALTDMRAANADLGKLAADKSAPGSADAAQLMPFADKTLADLDKRVPRLLVQMDRSAEAATLTVDDKPIASSAWPELPVAPGAHHLVARAHGRADDARDVKVVEGQRLAVSFASSAPVVSTPATGSATSTADAPKSESHGHGLAIATTAGAVALVAGGVVSFLVAGSLSSDAKDRCAGEVSCDPPRGSIRTWDTLALTGWIGGAALGAIAVYAWTTSSHDDGSTSARTELLVGPGNVGLKGAF